MNNKCFIEVDYYQKSKDQEHAFGDRFFSAKDKDEGRVITVLSDGLGSGVKANVLSTLTGSMLLCFMKSDMNIKSAAQIIMKTLPICRERKISYSTFTVADIGGDLMTRVIEYDNPPFLLIRNSKIVPLERQWVEVSDGSEQKRKVSFCTFQAQIGDRMVMCSDGVTQSAMGFKEYPLGWGEKGLSDYTLSLLKKNPNYSARDLSQAIVRRAWYHDSHHAKDDITCGSVYFRTPRTLMLITGPPFLKERDKELCQILSEFPGKKVICGGTTTNIVARELHKKVKVVLSGIDPDIPPYSIMKGIDLVTEGILTLGRASEILSQHDSNESYKQNPATMLVDMLLDSDIIYFVVGTKINEAHQDPNMPMELEIRRNIVKKIANLLQDIHLKEVHLQYI